MSRGFGEYQQVLASLMLQVFNLLNLYATMSRLVKITAPASKEPSPIANSTIAPR